ncbi:hypothetical protein GCM10007105_37070 [Shewanella chilikensis]|nr:hypothetical protein GCM10007105_37070 [Shewanella chilikensis]
MDFTTLDHIACFVDLSWFKSDHAAWAWYIGEPLLSFGQLTPAEVVRLFQESGIVSLNDWVTERELGGFQ